MECNMGILHAVTEDITEALEACQDILLVLIIGLHTVAEDTTESLSQDSLLVLIIRVVPLVDIKWRKLDFDARYNIGS